MTEFVTNMIGELSNIKINEIDPTTKFEDIEFDVIDLAELIMALEDSLEVSASIDTYYSKTIGELINHIEQLKYN